MLFSQDIGIDLGTANTLVFVKGKGIVIREPSVVAIHVGQKPSRVVAVGTQAKEMIGRTPGSITAMRPLRDGVIADFDITTEMLKKFMQKAMGGSFFAKARVVICIPSGVTPVERRAVKEAAEKAGADFVKTSTGFAILKGADGKLLPNGATTHAVSLMRKTVGDRLGVKASGGIHNWEEACAMVEAGANRIGASAGVQIVRS